MEIIIIVLCDCNDEGDCDQGGRRGSKARHGAEGQAAGARLQETAQRGVRVGVVITYPVCTDIWLSPSCGV